MVKIIQTEKAPSPIGPYSQGVRVNGFLFVSGQIPIDPQTGRVVTGTIQDQTRRVIENIKAIVEAAGLNLSTVVKTTIYLRDLKAFGDVNQVYSEFFNQTKPARSTIEVSHLPKDANIEIDAIAIDCEELK